MKEQIQNPHLKKLVDAYPQIEYGEIAGTSMDGSFRSRTYDVVGYTGVRDVLPHLSLLSIDSPDIQSAELIEFSEMSPQHDISTFSAKILLRYHP